jgi:hypothetical protein
MYVSSFHFSGNGTMDGAMPIYANHDAKQNLHRKILLLFSLFCLTWVIQTTHCQMLGERRKKARM